MGRDAQDLGKPLGMAQNQGTPLGRANAARMPCARTPHTFRVHESPRRGFSAEHFMSRDAQNQGKPLGVSLGFVHPSGFPKVLCIPPQEFSCP